jgi:hypothetical protein
MLLGMCLDIFESNDYKIFAANTYRLQFVRFACSIAMHLLLYPEVKKGMILMKYTNNHPNNFKAPSLAFSIGFMQFFTSVFAEFINKQFKYKY